MARRFLSLFCPALSNHQLTQLVEWCDGYSPLVAADGNDGVILDITGCTHLFGGEGPLLLDVVRRLRQMGIKSKAAIADAWSIAWALARYSKNLIVQGDNAISALAPLPIEALRLPNEIILELRRLGLSTIGAVKKIPRLSLAARFGVALTQRLDQIFHHAEEPLTPWRPPAPYRASRTAAEPIFTVSAVEYVLRDLLQEICERLEESSRGSRQMELACYRLDGTVDRSEVRTSKPTRSHSHLLNLFSNQLGVLRSGFGFEVFVLSVLDNEALDPIQLSLSQTDSIEENSSFDALADRLGTKLGFHAVNHICIQESLLPEHSIEFHPITSPAKASAEWPVYRIRPVQLIDPPMRIEVSILIPGGSPVQFILGQQKRRIIRSEGPERLTREWWRDKVSFWDTRDYYRIEDEGGFRFWIFRDSSEHWFLHGQFP
jgi:protein ImuB